MGRGKTKVKKLRDTQIERADDERAAECRAAIITKTAMPGQ